MDNAAQSDTDYIVNSILSPLLAGEEKRASIQTQLTKHLQSPLTNAAWCLPSPRNKNYEYYREMNALMSILNIVVFQNIEILNHTDSIELLLIDRIEKLLGRENREKIFRAAYNRSRRLAQRDNGKREENTDSIVRQCIVLGLNKYSMMRFHIRFISREYGFIRQLLIHRAFHNYCVGKTLIDEILQWRIAHGQNKNSILLTIFMDTTGSTEITNDSVFDWLYYHNLPSSFLDSSRRYLRRSFLLSTFANVKAFQGCVENEIRKVSTMKDIIVYEYEKIHGKRLLGAQKFLNQKGDDYSLSLHKGMEFIYSKQGKDGFWKDFMVLNRLGEDWITGYVGNALSGNFHNRQANRKAQAALIASKDKRGAWGYNLAADLDADSTAWCLQYLIKNNVPRKILKDAYSTLLSFYDPATGGFKTYSTLTSEKKTPDGWCSPHLCVTSLALQALLLYESPPLPILEKSIDYVRRHQADAGYWESYWWDGRIYGTVQALKALGGWRHESIGDSVEKGVRWLVANQNSDGGWNNGIAGRSNPFFTGLAISFLAEMFFDQYITIIKKGIDWLLKQQLDDGSWYSSQTMRVPSPEQTEPWTFRDWKTDSSLYDVLIEDGNRIFTTATVLCALHSYGKRKFDSQHRT